MNIEGVIILAGGKSRRMGRDKATMMLGEKTLLQWALDFADSESDNVLVAGPERRGMEACYIDDLPGYPPSSLLGLASALDKAQGEWQLVIGCDMPFVRPTLVDLLRKSANDGGAVACWHNRVQPLPLLLPRSRALPAALELLADNRFHLAALLDRLDPAVVPAQQVALADSEGHSFFNINSREDMDRARDMLDKG